VIHHTQFLNDLMEQGKLNPKDKGGDSLKVTYHDPCFLGKHQGILDEPRSVIDRLPGVERLEMTRHGVKSLCCGGGGGRMWADFDDERKLSEIRVKEALDTGASRIVTACPFCLQNLEDAVKTLDAEEALRVMDLAELTLEYL
jgi:Fe-S oxidoreductase